MPQLLSAITTQPWFSMIYMEEAPTKGNRGSFSYARKGGQQIIRISSPFGSTALAVLPSIKTPKTNITPIKAEGDQNESVQISQQG